LEILKQIWLWRMCFFKREELFEITLYYRREK
jgi:hypothetical protein